MQLVLRCSKVHSRAGVLATGRQSVYECSPPPWLSRFSQLPLVLELLLARGVPCDARLDCIFRRLGWPTANCPIEMFEMLMIVMQAR